MSFYRFIPKGPKYVVSFEKHQNKVCMFVKRYIKNKDTKKIKLNASFDPILSYGKGSKCYGTLIQYKGRQVFFLENVSMFQNKHVQNMSWEWKYNIMIHILKSVKPINEPNTIFMGLPVTRLKNNESDINYKLIETLPYSVYSIEHLQHRHRKTDVLVKTKTEQSNLKSIKYDIFTIKADIQSDIYHMYKTDYQGKVMIPTLKTSIMMNRYFRTIKENDNIDLIEESDDEEEFENIDATKYVDIDKSYHFKCMYNENLKAWIPIECVEECTEPAKLSSINI